MENRMVIKANAKINLFLNVTGLRKDNYHLIESVMQSITLSDTIYIKENNTDKINISCTDAMIPVDERNICYKATTEYFKNQGKVKGIDIFIEKNIPSQAGLGGGSADAGAALTGLNAIYKYYSNEELLHIGCTVGADVPFCMTGGTAFCSGIGEDISPISNIPECNILIAKGKAGISTKDAYKRIDELKNIPQFNNIKNIFDSNELSTITKNCYNIFELVAGCDDVIDIKRIMNENNAVCSCMTGSGSAVFGIFTDKSYCNKCCDILTGEGYFTFSCLPDNKGVYIL